MKLWRIYLLIYSGLDQFLGKDPLSKEEKERLQSSEQINRYKYGGRGREWNPNFVKYMYKIVNHHNYKKMPWGIDKKGKIRWNAPSHRPPGGKWSNLHNERLDWWKKKALEINVPIEGKWISKKII